MKSTFRLAMVALVLVLLAAVLFYSNGSQSSAPSVQYTSIKGEQLQQDALRGKVVLVNFWYPTCPGCVTEMPKLVDTYKKYQARGYTTVAVAMNIDPPAYVAAFAEKFGLPFFVAFDADGSLAKRFGDVTLAPTSFLIDKRGRIVQRYLGEPDMGKLHALIEEKLAES
ncbi:peroxiredoxin family protein [Chitinimonas sp.]|uniref:peroxiredoxin family protein n=1 Tax=Chitinimonas sp. TaxID=1934313 RepID=UPI0035B2566E